MRITKKISMVRYISRSSDEGKEVFDHELWFARKEPLDVPYYKIRVKIIATEDRFKSERGKKHE